MTDPIGRADYELRAPLDPLKKDLADAKAAVTRSGQEAEAELTARSSRWGPALRQGAEQGVKVVAATAAGLFAVATKGAFQLQDVMNRYQADTGATAEEAAAAGRVINKVAGENRLSLEAVGDAAAKIRSDLGAVGPVADDLTGRFARYARVTKQDVGGSVSAFDDILDGWNLTAEDSGAIMDRLVRSHQLYGGVVAQDQAALAALAPVMRAANLTIDDGVALLNLMKSSGVDSAAAVTGLRTALSNVRSPEELQRLVADISATEDPFLRAQKAADLFGDRAGPKLANALAGKELADFALDAEEVAGATDRANDALDSSFPAWLMKRASIFGASLRQLGTDWGPAVTGAASFTTALAAIVGPEATRTLTRSITGALRGAWAAAAGSGPVQAVVRAAAVKATAVYLAASIASSSLAETIRAAWAASGASPIVARAAGAAGLSGASAYVLAAKGAVVVGVAALADEVGPSIDKAGQDIGQAIRDALDIHIDGFEGIDIGSPEDWPWPIGNKNAPDWAKFSNDAEEHGRAIGQAASRGVADGAATMGDTGGATGRAFVTEAQRELSREALRTAAEQAIDGIVDAVRSSKDELVGAWRDALTERNRAADIKDQLLINRAEQRAQQRILVDEEASKAEQAQARIRLRQLKAENDLLLVEQSNYGDRATQIARTKALLTSRALLRGLKDKDPEVRAHWEEVRDRAETKLEALQRAAGTWGERTGLNYAKSLKGTAWAAGLAAEAIAAAVSDNIRVSSPARRGPLSKGGGPEGYGRRFIDLYARGLSAGLPAVNALFGGLSTPGLATAAAATFAPAPDRSARNDARDSTSTLTFGDIHLHGVGSDVTPARAKRFAEAVRDEVGLMFREQSARSVHDGRRARW